MPWSLTCKCWALRSKTNIEAGAIMNFTLLSSVFTVISLLVFLGIWYWAFAGKNKARFEALAYLPLEQDDALPAAPAQSNLPTGA